MAQYLSEDLRIRVIRAIEGGLSRHGAAHRFGVGVASAVCWMDEYLRTGRTAPKSRGGDRRSVRIEAQAGFLMDAIEETPDIALVELRERLIEEREDVTARRKAWFELQPDLDPAKLVFLDEIGTTTRMARLRARSPRGERWRPLEDNDADRRAQAGRAERTYGG